MRPILFQISGYPVSSYGFFMMIGHLAGVAALLWIARAYRLPLGALIDMVIAVVIGGVIGARLGYAYNHWNEFSAAPASLFSLWKGGLSFYGGFPPAFFAFLLVLRWRRLPFFAVSDLVCPVLPFSLGLVRIGCFLQGCCYGAPTEVPWAVTFTSFESKVPSPLLHLHLHPTQLYEAAFLFLLAAGLAFAQRRNRLPPGMLATFSIFAYAVYRLIADQYRGDIDRNFWGVQWLGATQAAAMVGILSAPVVLWLCWRARKAAA
jgi:phosphatidylglycerol:prolipoprotein diacylglycerol transferase